MQTESGALKIAAAKLGIPVEEYNRRKAAGLKHCRICRVWTHTFEFNIDRSRSDGLSSVCQECQSRSGRANYTPISKYDQKPKGPSPCAQRGGDKRQARARVNHFVQSGKLANPNVLSCAVCGHLGNGRRHEYHHYLGYGVGHHLDVIALCSACHPRRDE